MFRSICEPCFSSSSFPSSPSPLTSSDTTSRENDTTSNINVYTSENSIRGYGLREALSRLKESGSPFWVHLCMISFGVILFFAGLYFIVKIMVVSIIVIIITIDIVSSNSYRNAVMFLFLFMVAFVWTVYIGTVSAILLLE